MVTKVDEGMMRACEDMSPAQEARLRRIVVRVAAKWPMSVLHVLAEADGPLRFSRLHERMDGISQKMLTQTLKSLERDGLVTRTVYAEVPPRVDYVISDLGEELRVQIVPLWRWIVEHLSAFESGREASLLIV